MEKFFQIVAVILAGVAAYFLWHGNADRAFVSAVGGAVSFFFSVRVQVKGRLNEREVARLAAEKASDELAEADAEIDGADPAKSTDNEQSTISKP